MILHDSCLLIFEMITKLFKVKSISKVNRYCLELKTQSTPPRRNLKMKLSFTPKTASNILRQNYAAGTSKVNTEPPVIL